MSRLWDWVCGRPLLDRDAVLSDIQRDVTYLVIAAVEQNKRILDLRGLTMTTQADIDALTAQLADLKTALVADDAAIQAEIANLESQGVDVTALQAAVADLSAQVDATGALVPPADGA